MYKLLAKKIISLFSVIRIYNIIVIIAAQYLAAIFIFSQAKLLKTVIFDVNLLYLILATMFAIASGYIINNFYDLKADSVNRPLKTTIDNLLSLETKLRLYFIFNFIAVCFTSLVSWKATFFFGFYIFLLWLYSHKLKKYPLLGLVSATILALLPFFVLLVYYENYSKIIFVHALFLGLIIMVRELVKDLENIKGTIVNDYKKFPVVYGEPKTKQLITIIVLIALIPTFVLSNYAEIEHMQYYFFLAGFVFVIISILIWRAKTVAQYQLLHNILKLLLLTGVFSLLLIDKTLVLEKVVKLLQSI